MFLNQEKGNTNKDIFSQEEDKACCHNTDQKFMEKLKL